MKKTAKYLALLLIAVLFLQAVPAYADGTLQASIRGAVQEAAEAAETEETAEADGPQYSNTIAFTQMLDEDGILYRYGGIDSDGDECVRIDERDEDSGTSYTMNLYFNEDQDLISIRVWYVIEFAEENIADVMRVCNDINYSYRYIKIYVDESDNTVSADMDVIVRESDLTGEIAYEAALRMEILLGYAYEMLSEYAI